MPERLQLGSKNATTGTLLEALLAEEVNVLKACGGNGVCATCHVHVRRGKRLLTPETGRETRTLSIIAGRDDDSRLSCQAWVIGDGVVEVELPEGIYVERSEDLMPLLEARADADHLHPIDGSVLAAKGTIMSRTRLEELQHLDAEVEELKNAED
jgi:ferredoxin